MKSEFALYKLAISIGVIIVLSLVAIEWIFLIELDNLVESILCNFGIALILGAWIPMKIQKINDYNIKENARNNVLLRLAKIENIIEEEAIATIDISRKKGLLRIFGIDPSIWRIEDCRERINDELEEILNAERFNKVLTNWEDIDIVTITDTLIDLKATNFGTLDAIKTARELQQINKTEIESHRKLFVDDAKTIREIQETLQKRQREK